MLFKDDLISRYASRRKNMPEKEVRDLLNHVLGYLKEKVQSEDEYAYKIPTIGTLYKKFKYEKDYEGDALHHQMRFEKMLNPKKNPLFLRSYIEKDFPNWTLEEIQQWQNES